MKDYFQSMIYYSTINTFLLISLLFQHGISSTENILDVSFPIIITDGNDENSAGETLSKSLFGYTVSLASGLRYNEGKSSQDPDGW